jgi:hypothetical protein
MQWVLDELMNKSGQFLIPGYLYVSISSLHVFVGDLYAIRKTIKA